MDIINLMKQIKELYHTIKHISAALINDFSGQALDECLKKRETLLREIYRKEALYSQSNGSMNTDKEFQCLRNEIREQILTINSMDRQITELIEQSMRDIKLELSGLYSTSKAAFAYTVQKRV